MQREAGQDDRSSGKTQEPDTYRSSTSSRSSSSSSILPTTQLNRTQSQTEFADIGPEAEPRWLRSARSKNEIGTILQGSALSGIVSWLSGPSPPRTYSIQPIASNWQVWPQEVLFGYLPRLPESLVSWALFLLWVVTFGALLGRSNWQDAGESSDVRPMRLACNTRLW